MDPDAKVQVPTMGTKLEYSTDGTKWTRVYGLASTPDIGGQPNMIDTTTLDNTVAETSTVGLQPASEISYEFNVQELNDNSANLRLIKNLADNKTKAKWRLTKASGITIEYEAIPTISYSADEQGGIEKFVMYHDLKSDMTITLPTVSA
jgi:hypothetical protein